MADVGSGRKPWLVVSNNARNRHLDSCLAVRITTTPKPPLKSIVQLGPGEPVVGRILCDDIAVIFDDELVEDRGALSPLTMDAVAAALKVALGLNT